jgi:hypothetical protein
MNSAGQTVAPESGCFDRDGFTFIRALLPLAEVERLRAAVVPLFQKGDRAGVRGLLQDCPTVAELAKLPALVERLTDIVGATPFAVRGILFDKNPDANWRVAWHQDLAIAVRERADIPGFGPWSVKGGVVHAHAPMSVLERMLTVRIHLDDADETNGALQILPDSHRSGKLDGSTTERKIVDTKPVICTARAGDALVMRPLLLHASAPAVSPTHRRVIHIEYAVDELPDPLQWFERV